MINSEACNCSDQLVLSGSLGQPYMSYVKKFGTLPSDVGGSKHIADHNLSLQQGDICHVYSCASVVVFGILTGTVTNQIAVGL